MSETRDEATRVEMKGRNRMTADAGHEPPPSGRAAARNASGRAASNPRREMVREQLIDIAAALFEKKGFDQTNMNDIAGAIGLGRSAVYHYFRSKEEILAALVESESIGPSGELEKLRDTPGLSASDKLRRAIVMGVTRRLSGQSRFNMLSRLEPQIPEELRPQYDHSRRYILDLYVNLIEAGVASGEFREVNPKIAAFAVIGMANWTSRWFSPNGSMSPAEIGAQVADFAVHALVAKSVVGLDAGSVRQITEALRGQLDAMDQLLG